MKQKSNLQYLSAILCMSLSLFTMQLVAAEVSGTPGVVTDLDLQGRTITINSMKLGLSDPVQVFAPDNTLISQAGLKIGQSVEYWQTPNKETKSDMVNKIRIVNQYNGSLKR